MTRDGHTLKDKGHYTRKAVGYTVLVILLPVAVLCELGRILGEYIDKKAVHLHRWMRPCLYTPRNKENR